MSESLFSKFADLQFYQKETLTQVFSVNITKFLRTVIFIEHPRSLFLPQQMKIYHPFLTWDYFKQKVNLYKKCRLETYG